MASGGPGGGNEPPGRRHGGGEILTRRSDALAAEPLLPSRVALGCNRLCELRRCCRAPGPSPGEGGCRGSDGAGPVISIRRVAHSLRTASGRQLPVPFG